MVKRGGTASKGKKSKKKIHIRCRRCGRHSYNIRKKYCSHCGYGRYTKLRSYKWIK
ncbi:MAG: 50S ribosomal protein L37e [Candidatus Parvarchaeota archaeon]|nr:50S ribosomal protein L37e [Candidatus Jingweiarchaeum tengchongense]MCW1298297.1 50S ribosomal protein L37e [Candidatus Jingweiarchaeum tengchongense]MCW1300388.1 50S ribosomal protein L37e [Candidatus Jingweiarchaeum tengchongense]MCW1304767.1 50S ribosomal protein L37e [Candidatus Jingweiarchaeum tengchongense]MCW1305357.1 50S ribosomal protein L37e [Candidatus Jingweiarchaeum tengchongense]